MEYYIRRRNGLMGSFDLETLKEKIQSNQLQNFDEIGESKKGPWKSVAQWSASISLPNQPETLATEQVDGTIPALAKLGPSTKKVSPTALHGSGVRIKEPKRNLPVPAKSSSNTKRSTSGNLNNSDSIETNEAQEKQNSWQLYAGFLYAFLSLLIIPPLLAAVGIYYGIKNINKGNSELGQFQVILSILGGLIGMAVGVYLHFNPINHFGR